MRRFPSPQLDPASSLHGGTRLLFSSESERAKAVRSRQVADEVSDRLRQQPRFSGRDLSCECADGVIRLVGRLPSFYEKQIAQEVVRRLEGVSDIINDIEVTE